MKDFMDYCDMQLQSEMYTDDGCAPVTQPCVYNGLSKLPNGGGVRSELDEGLHLLHLVGVGHADNAAHLHAVVRVEYILNLAGVDVVAGAGFILSVNSPKRRIASKCWAITPQS